MINWIREFGWVMDDLARDKQWATWLIHGALALVIIFVVSRWPWTAPGLVYLWRELGQMWDRFVANEGFDWLDHVMDVAVPTVVGYVFLH